MKLDYVEVCGFRGFRAKARIDFGGGFTVITGRNGVGKSTLCDAVEFAITGLIEKYTVEKAAKESLTDYLWWRGAGEPEAHYVTAAFASDEGKPFKITRTRETGASVSPEEIQAALCSRPAPEDALRQLTRTSIIRDEWIAALSLDLSETERFDLVRSALGALEGSEAAAKAKDVISAADTSHARNEAAYENARARLGERLTQQSKIRASLSRSGDVSAALEIVGTAVPNAPTDMVLRLEAARGELADGRTRNARSAEAVEAGRVLLARQRAFQAPDAVTARETAKAELEKTREAKNIAFAGVAPPRRCSPEKRTLMRSQPRLLFWSSTASALAFMRTIAHSAPPTEPRRSSPQAWKQRVGGFQASPPGFRMPAEEWLRPMTRREKRLPPSPWSSVKYSPIRPKSTPCERPNRPMPRSSSVGR
jgi:DNA repair exonuclease SbcCD ATPase subunit